MARIRSIKPEFWTSEQVVDCSPMARLLFIGLWNFSDDAGVHPTNLKRIKMNVFPGDEIELSNIRRLIEELDGVGLIELYTVEDKEYLRVTGWDSHQKIEKPSFKYPGKDGIVPKGRKQSSKESGTVGDHSPPDRSGVDRSGVDRSGDSRIDDDLTTPTKDQQRESTRLVNERAGEVYQKLEPLLDLTKPLPFAPIRGWIQAGYAPDLDILPTVREVLGKKRQADPAWRPGSLNYFADAIKRAHLDRTAATAAGVSSAPATPKFTGNEAEGRSKLLSVYAGFVNSGRGMPDITQADVDEMIRQNLVSPDKAKALGFAA